MNEHDIAEQAYKNGYEAGKRAAAEGADMVKAVRCGDCKSCWKFQNNTFHCIHPRGLTGSLTEDLYCSFGERKEQSNDNSC